MNSAQRTWRETRRYMDYQYELTRRQQRHEERFARQQAQSARAYEQRMADTAHQREIADLREAGLNPVLTATGGSGASTPSADTAAVQSIASAIPQMFATAQTYAQAAVQSAKAEKAKAKASYNRSKKPSQNASESQSDSDTNNTGVSPIEPTEPNDKPENEVTPNSILNDDYYNNNPVLDFLYENTKDMKLTIPLGSHKVDLTGHQAFVVAETAYLAIKQGVDSYNKLDNDNVLKKVVNYVAENAPKEFGNIIKDIDSAQQRKAIEDMADSYYQMNRVINQTQNDIDAGRVLSGKYMSNMKKKAEQMVNRFKRHVEKPWLFHTRN